MLSYRIIWIFLVNMRIFLIGVCGFMRGGLRFVGGVYDLLGLEE